MAASPQFISTPRVATVNIATANTAIDGTGTITTLIAGSSSGTRILEIVAKGAATGAACLVNVFLSTDGGTTWRIFDTISLAAATVSATVASARTSTLYTNVLLASSSHVIGVTVTVSQSVNVHALGGDL